MRASPLSALPLLALPLFVACGAGTRPAHSDRAPGRYVETLVIGGQKRRFILRVPKSYDGSKSIPVVMVLHGWTASAEAAEQYTRMSQKAEKEGFAVVFPDGAGDPKGWNAGFIDLTGMHADDLKFLTAVLDRVESEVSVDRDREYVVGHSNGAFMANALAAKLGGRLAAVASVSGAVGLRPDAEIPTPSAPVSVILLHGKADTMVAYAPGAGALLQTVGAVASAKFWAKADGCRPTPDRTHLFGGKVTSDLYSGGKNGTEVELISVNGAPHDWWGGLGYRGGKVVEIPTYGVPAADVIWQFFKTHPRRQGGP